MSVSSVAVCWLITWDWTCGLSVCVTRPSGSVTDWTKVGRISVPPLATVAATSAICSGVTSRLAWPMATRPMSMGSDALSRWPLES